MPKDLGDSKLCLRVLVAKQHYPCHQVTKTLRIQKKIVFVSLSKIFYDRKIKSAVEQSQFRIFERLHDMGDILVVDLPVGNHPGDSVGLHLLI